MLCRSFAAFPPICCFSFAFRHFRVTGFAAFIATIRCQPPPLILPVFAALPSARCSLFSEMLFHHAFRLMLILPPPLFRLLTDFRFRHFSPLFALFASAIFDFTPCRFDYIDAFRFSPALRDAAAFDIELAISLAIFTPLR
jgi:hypothetical protein